MSTETPTSIPAPAGGRFNPGRWLPLAGHPLSANDLRQCLRAAAAGTLGFLACKIFDWNYGVFFTVYPVLLVGLLPVFSGHIARQFVAAAMINSVEVGLIAGFFSHMPLVMTIIVFGLFFFRFRLMSRGPLLLFGVSSVISLSVMFNFASYPTTDLYDLLIGNVAATWLSVLIAALVYYWFPDADPRSPPPRVEKSIERIRHETLLGASLATLSFLVFQLMSLHDSLSAQVASILILFPMHYRGIIAAARWRVIGVILGCFFGLLVQLLLYDNFHMLLLILPLFWVGLMLGARMHVTEKVGSGIGFGAMTTVAILFGQYLQPNQDLVYTDLYRIGSVAVALLVTLAAVYIAHTVLNLFAATRFIPD